MQENNPSFDPQALDYSRQNNPEQNRPEDEEEWLKRAGIRSELEQARRIEAVQSLTAPARSQTETYSRIEPTPAYSIEAAHFSRYYFVWPILVAIVGLISLILPFVSHNGVIYDAFGNILNADKVIATVVGSDGSIYKPLNLGIWLSMMLGLLLFLNILGFRLQSGWRRHPVLGQVSWWRSIGFIIANTVISVILTFSPLNTFAIPKNYYYRNSIEPGLEILDVLLAFVGPGVIGISIAAALAVRVKTRRGTIIVTTLDTFVLGLVLLVVPFVFSISYWNLVFSLGLISFAAAIIFLPASKAQRVAQEQSQEQKRPILMSLMYTGLALTLLFFVVHLHERDSAALSKGGYIKANSSLSLMTLENEKTKLVKTAYSGDGTALANGYSGGNLTGQIAEKASKL